MVDEEEYLRLIDQMRISVPQEISRAREIEAEREAILAKAHEQAKAMLEEARLQAERLVAEHTIMAQAQDRSAEILRHAYEDAETIRMEADAYALQVLEQLETQLAQFSRQVGKGIELLRSRGSVAETAADQVEPEIIGAENGADR